MVWQLGLLGKFKNHVPREHGQCAQAGQGPVSALVSMIYVYSPDSFVYHRERVGPRCHLARVTTRASRHVHHVDGVSAATAFGTVNGLGVSGFFEIIALILPCTFAVSARCPPTPQPRVQEKQFEHRRTPSKDQRKQKLILQAGQPSPGSSRSSQSETRFGGALSTLPTKNLGVF